jgi:hypothetical protein
MSYVVQYSDGDANGGYNGVFTDITTVTDPNPVGAPGTMSFTDDYSLTPTVATSICYYRIRLP